MLLKQERIEELRNYVEKCPSQGSLGRFRRILHELALDPADLNRS